MCYCLHNTHNAYLICYLSSVHRMCVVLRRSDFVARHFFLPKGYSCYVQHSAHSIEITMNMWKVSFALFVPAYTFILSHLLCKEAAAQDNAFEFITRQMHVRCAMCVGMGALMTWVIANKIMSNNKSDWTQHTRTNKQRLMQDAFYIALFDLSYHYRLLRLIN